MIWWDYYIFGVSHIMRYRITVVFLIYFFMVAMASHAVAGGTPTEQLKPTLDSLLELLVDPALSGEEHKTERRRRVMETINDGFDFREMSKRVLGKTWRDINEEERSYFTKLMTDLLENAYIGKLENYSGQKLEFTGEKINNKKAQVSTTVENNGVKIPVHYIMRQKGSKWMVYDINIEGVSLIRNYMQQFKSIVRQDKYEGLVKVLEEKNKSF
jgi:phospholipid transport system substrate-binding protein